MKPLLAVESVSKTFRPNGKEPVVGLEDVTLHIPEGEITGLVGESGSGKSTLIRCIFRLTKPDTGLIDYDRIDVTRAHGEDLRRLRREVQLVFQDPAASLNPRMTVEQLVSEGMRVHKLFPSTETRRDRVVELLEAVGLDAADLGRRPRSFSGGQRQRIAIARAVAVGPRLLVCDEPVSSLDVSVQAQVLNLLLDMRDAGLTMLFVAHDLAVVHQVCSQVAVIQHGRIVERGPVGEPVASCQNLRQA